MAAALACGDHDFAFLHVKAVDDTGHDRDTALKVVRAYALTALPRLFCSRALAVHAVTAAAAVQLSEELVPGSPCKKGCLS